MKYLLDTHVFLWWITDSSLLSKTARRAITESSNELNWSSASSWEISIKFANGKLPLPDEPESFILSELTKNQISSLAITDQHSFLAGKLPVYHRDPFDRMLIAQSKIEKMPLITNDKEIKKYDVEIIW